MGIGEGLVGEPQDIEYCAKHSESFYVREEDSW